MFRRMARFLGQDGAVQLMRLHPADLTALLEFAWDRRSNNPEKALGDPARRSDLNGFGTTWFGASAFDFEKIPDQTITDVVNGLNITEVEGSNMGRTANLFDHAIYAFMIENTRVYDIFRRVVDEFQHGERIGAPTSVSGDTQRWLRNTEELLYRDPTSLFVQAIDSWVRPDITATRRNLFQRMFGMELNHGTEDNKPYPYRKAETANSEFVTTFEEFLREVWIGIENVNNESGFDPTDDAKIADLAEKLFDMLRTRREAGNLSREEFDAVARMSWCHLTLDTNNLTIIQDLRAQASSAEERLFKIAQRVGLPAHGLSKSYFDIADDISRILIEIETGIFNDADAVPALYTPENDGPEQAMRNIIRHWSTITGREMKARRVTAT
jgi:hypothetical protein